MKWFNSKTQRYPEYEKQLHSNAGLEFSEGLTKKEMVRFSCLTTL